MPTYQNKIAIIISRRAGANGGGAGWRGVPDTLARRGQAGLPHSRTTGGRIDTRRELSTAARALATVRAGRDLIPGM